MIYTARQLEALNKANGHVTLPRGAGFTPLAMDWLKARRVAVQYEQECGGCAECSGQCPCGEQPSAERAPAAASVGCAPRTFAAPAEGPEGARNAAYAQRGVVWWADGDCGPAKAAIVQAEREASVSAMAVPAEIGQTHRVVQQLAAAVASGRAAGGILVVQHAAAAMLFANRCPSLRAVLGTSIGAVDAGVRQIAANVLVIEHPRQTFQQVRNLISRFVRGGGALSDELSARLEELATCA